MIRNVAAVNGQPVKQAHANIRLVCTHFRVPEIDVNGVELLKCKLKKSMEMGVNRGLTSF
jgi:hypothetical protein